MEGGREGGREGRREDQAGHRRVKSGNMGTVARLFVIGSP